MKGIILAGGTGSRLWPITSVLSKQLLPIYDKPMIYYPISTLMLAGIREILIITTPRDSQAFKELLGDGSDFGISFSFATQHKPEGLAQAFIIGEEFLNDNSCMMILGDNIFHGVGMGQQLIDVDKEIGAHVFTYHVANPIDYGVLKLNQANEPISITEKPKTFISNLAVTGLYFFDRNVSRVAKAVTRSDRGELEITSVIQHYIESKTLTFTKLSRGTAWLDTGSVSTLNDASAYIRIIEERTGLKVACLEEIAAQKGWIGADQLAFAANKYGNSEYGKYLRMLRNT